MYPVADAGVQALCDALKRPDVPPARHGYARKVRPLSAGKAALHKGKVVMPGSLRASIEVTKYIIDVLP